MTIEYINRPDYESLFNGCVGYWDFRNDAKDCINGNDGTVSGASLTTNRFGMQNSAYSFDGTNDYIQIMSNGFGTFNLQTYTISAWIKVDNTTGKKVIWSYDYTSSTYPSYAQNLHISGNEIYIIHNMLDGSTVRPIDWDTAVYINASTYYHIVAVVSTASGVLDVRLYLNGSKVFTDNWGGSATNITYYNQEVWIGKDNFGGYFDGKIEEPMFFNRTFSDAEVLALYNLTSMKPIYPYMRRTCQR